MPIPINLNRFAQIKATGHLPSPRGVALAVMRIAHDETVSTVELAQTIKVDPAFVGRLIKAANGALFRQRPIVSVQEALMVVGIPAVRAMALGFSLLSNYRKGACEAFDYVRFWSSSVIMALAMQALAARMQMVATDELFSVGLLAQIGELALATVYPDKYGQLLKEAAAGGDLPALEKQILAMTHADLSTAMLMDWGLPPVFTEPARYFERPQEAPFSSDCREMLIMQCLVLAKCVADICLSKPEEQGALTGKAVRQAAHLGCGRDVFIRDCREIASQWLEWSRLLQLDGVEIPSFEALGGVELNAQEPKIPPAESESGDKGKFHAEVASVVRALVVTTDIAVRKHLLEVLDEADIKAFEYLGQDGFMERILDLQPQILLLDVGENVASAVRLVRTLRASRLGRGMYILLLLPSSDEKNIAADDAGADDFFVKGSGDKALWARLGTARRVVLLQRELEREREELRHFAAELAISNRSLQEAALTDSLTGLPNRRYAIERIQQEWGASDRNARPLACMVIDLDGFKQINDLYGHDVGDIALRFASESLRRVLRGQDVICRMGGDEFLVICPEASQNDSMVCAERLRKEIEQLTVNNEENELRLTVSIGVAVRDESMASASDLIKRADCAVFRAKRLGRNRVVPDFGMERVKQHGGRGGGFRER